MEDLPHSLSHRTRAVLEVLLALSEDGVLTLTLDDLAEQCGVTRRALTTHLARLRTAGHVGELEAFAVDGGWRRARWVRRTAQRAQQPTQTPYPNPHYAYEVGKHAVPSERLRLSYGTATRLRRRAEDVDMINDPLDDALNSHLPARPFDHRQLPAYPSATLYRPAHVPRMPRTQGDPSADAGILIRAYRCAILRRYGTRARIDKKVAFRMRHAAELIHRLKIVPHAWVAFRFTQYEWHEQKNTKPSIDYVFSRKVIEANVDQYRGVADSFDVLNKVELTPSHKKLLELWEKCRRAVASPKHPEGRVVTERIVNGILPPELYRELADAIEKERGAMEADFYRRAAAGEWIW